MSDVKICACGHPRDEHVEEWMECMQCDCETLTSPVTIALELGKRFVGFSLEHRSDPPREWRGRWRAYVVTAKRYRQEYAEPCFGDTCEAACVEVLNLVRRLDGD